MAERRQPGRDVLGGRDKGPVRDMTLLNAAATLMAAGIADSLRDGVQMSARAIDSGAAAQTLSRLAQKSIAPG